MKMKIVRSCARSNSWRNCNFMSRVIRVLDIHPARTLTTSTVPNEVTLYSRLLQVGDPKVSIVPILDQWIDEGRGVRLLELQKIIRQFRKFRRIKHALQISEWMTGKSYLNLSSADVAVQLDLISKVHGVEQAEEYFNNIPNKSKTFHVYGALLNCYADAKLLEKAEAVMQEMKELSYARTLSYNVMMNLYSHLGQHDKLEFLMQEMEEKGINCDKFTYNIRLNAYAVALDIDGMEKLLMKMEADSLVTMDWNAYVVVAKGYSRAGNMEKALASLRKSEQLLTVSTRKFAYEVLITLYAGMGYRDEVYRIWNLYKKTEKFYNSGYICVISSLAKLNDLDGAEKVLDEWEAKRIHFDFRVPNLLIFAYCQKGLSGKAEKIVNRLIESGHKPNASTWSRMAIGYHQENQLEKTVESLNKAIQVSEPGWTPPFSTLVSCLRFLKEKGDLDMAEQIKRSLAKQGIDYTNVHDNNYLSAISSLVQLDDLDGAEKLLDKWEAKGSSFDLRVPNVLIFAYCKNGLLGKAEKIVNRLMESGKEPNASSWSRMAIGYNRENQMEKAVDSLNKAIQASEPEWTPPFSVLVSCIRFLKEKGDLDAAEQIKRSLAEQGHEKLVEAAVESPDFKASEQTGSDDQQALEEEMLGRHRDEVRAFCYQKPNCSL